MRWRMIGVKRLYLTFGTPVILFLLMSKYSSDEKADRSRGCLRSFKRSLMPVVQHVKQKTGRHWDKEIVTGNPIEGLATAQSFYLLYLFVDADDVPLIETGTFVFQQAFHR